MSHRILVYVPEGCPGPPLVWVRPGLLRRLGFVTSPRATLNEYIHAMRELADSRAEPPSPRGSWVRRKRNR